MSHKSQKIAALIRSLDNGPFDSHYLGYFECFNQQLFFEAHEVLEELWLPERGGVKGLFYQGLIQLAGAFVHLQKKRPQPAQALFRLAQKNLTQYPEVFEGLDLVEARGLISSWLERLNSRVELPLLEAIHWPRLALKVPAKISP